KIYSENKVTFCSGKPEKIVQDILSYRTSGSVLELGAGEGRNSLFLSSNGFDVTAQDISEVGVSKIIKHAADQNLKIHTEIGDARTLTLNRNFDVFVCTFTLHHLLYNEALALIEQIRKHTDLNGLNVITVFTKNGDFYKKNPSTDNFYPDTNELKEFYADWEILEYEEVQGKAFQKNPDGSPMFNIAAKLLARKI
ncbi:MAG: methyltransferase domain-containing protein, partial [bacterium]|nr:methyltransferase domain-containing protein [bacterium]